MARGDNLRQSQLMIQAEESGQAARARAHSELMADSRANRQEFLRMGETAGQMIEAAEGRKQQESQFARGLSLEAAKAGFEQGSEPAAQGQPTEKSFADQMQESAKQANAARNPKAAAREAQVKAEMAKGASQPRIGPLDPESQSRLSEQGRQPMEMGSDTRWRRSEWGKQQDEQAREIKRHELATERIRAEAYRDQVGQQVQAAKAKGAKEDADKLETTLVAGPNGLTSKFDTLMKARQGKEMASDEDWAALEKMANQGTNPPADVLADIEKQDFSPRVQQFLRSQIDLESMKYILRTGDTGKLKVDETSPKQMEFRQNVSYFNSLAKDMGPQFAEFARINSIEDKMNFLHQQAAMATLLGMNAAQFRQKYDQSGEGMVTGDEMGQAEADLAAQGQAPAGGPALAGNPAMPQGQKPVEDPRAAQNQAFAEAERKRKDRAALDQSQEAKDRMMDPWAQMGAHARRDRERKK